MKFHPIKPCCECIRSNLWIHESWTLMSEFPECVARFPFHSGGWGLMVCLLDVAPAFATVRNRPQLSATVRHRLQSFAAVRLRSLLVWPCLWEVLQKWSLLKVSNVAQPRFFCGKRGTLYYFNMFHNVTSRFVWQAQYVCKVFRRWVQFFVACAALYRPPSSFWVAGAALWTRGLKGFRER